MLYSNLEYCTLHNKQINKTKEEIVISAGFDHFKSLIYSFCYAQASNNDDMSVCACIVVHLVSQ